MSDGDAALLTAFRTGDMAQPLRAALATLGTPADAVEASLHRLHHRPGVDVSAGFSVSYRADGRVGGVYLIATTARLPAAAQVATVPVGGTEVSVWRHPDDPYLPGLRPACDTDVVSLWLDAYPVEAKMTAYRPIRRAVLRYAAGERLWFAKVVRPTRLAELIDRHLIMSEASLSPAVLGTPAPGTVLLAAADGASLTATLASALEGTSPLPDPVDIVALLDRLPNRVMGLSSRPAWVDHLDFHSEAAAAVHPGRRTEIADLAGRVQRVVDSEPVGPLVPTHGDFYEANVFVADGGPRQLIDVDALGPGHREDDLACLLGHLAVLPVVSPRHFRGIEPVVDAWADVFESLVPSVAGLRARVAAVVLSLVAGAQGRSGEQRFDIARSWLLRAESGNR
ncbi:phosphotransferase [Propionicicella superfundia]|uniref:phosphotransferase n=1 Tax=Propionicicella superfundia TaxID=348582 RepID=UPI00042365B8|nr:phosphotransferase [Propionicicella superfundia]